MWEQSKQTDKGIEPLKYTQSDLDSAVKKAVEETKRMMVSVNLYNDTLRDKESLQAQLNEAQQWIDSEPDWKDKYMANYASLQSQLLTTQRDNERLRQELQSIANFCNPNSDWRKLRIIENALSTPPSNDLLHRIRKFVIESEFACQVDAVIQKQRQELLAELGGK